MPTLVDLAERVEGLAEPDAEIDMEIAQALGWWQEHSPHLGWFWHTPSRGILRDVPAYTASLDAVVALIGEKLPRWGWEVRSRITGTDLVSASVYEPGQTIGCLARTAPLALLAACLRALAKEPS
jgi:hypothetical protein